MDAIGEQDVDLITELIRSLPRFLRKSKLPKQPYVTRVRTLVLSSKTERLVKLVDAIYATLYGGHAG